ncbi:MAG: lipopolysaccharide kinase InaA family protein [Porticoccaceae bacterium]
MGRNFRGVIDRDWFAESPQALIAAIDALIAAGEVIKSNASTTVSKTRYAGRDIVIKRYNRKGLSHALGVTLRGSRARRVWANTLALLPAGIATPAPLAWFEVKRKGLIQAAYLITAFSPAPTLHTLLLENRVSADQWRQILAQVRELVDRLHAFSFTHGDLKHTNILFDGEHPIIIDLDSLEVDANRRRFARKQAEDRAALARRIESDPAEYVRRKKIELNIAD